VLRLWPLLYLWQKSLRHKFKMVIFIVLSFAAMC